MLRIIFAVFALLVFYVMYLVTDYNVAVLSVIVVVSLFAHLITWNKVPIIPEPDASIRMGKDYILPIVVATIAIGWLVANANYLYMNWRF